METFSALSSTSASSIALRAQTTSDATDMVPLSSVPSSSMVVPLVMPTPSGSDLPPLPSISPPSSAFASSSSFPVGQPPSPTWSPQEMQTLLAGLAQFPSDQFDAVTRYIKIAALLPGKCVRDVALQAKALATTGDGAAASWLSSQFPSPARAAKRMKIEPFGGPLYQHQTDPFAMPPTPSVAMASGGRRGASGELDDDVARQLDALLQDNVMAISTMRANLLGGKPGDNAPQMSRFHNNCQTVVSTLGGACVSLPPLPVRPDASLLSGSREPNDDQQPS